VFAEAGSLILTEAVAVVIVAVVLVAVVLVAVAVAVAAVLGSVELRQQHV
jgi:hypothetical protein